MRMITYITKAFCRILVLAILTTCMILPAVPIYADNKNKEIIGNMISAGEEAYHSSNYIDAIKLFLESKEKADAANLPKYSCFATYNIGVCYFFISENGEALKNYYDAYTICQNNELGWETESMIMNGIAGVYFEEENYIKSREIIIQCYKEAINKKDSNFVCAYALDLALIANKEKKFTESAEFLKVAREYDNNKSQSRILAVEAEAMFMQKKYDQVIAISNELLSSPTAEKADKGIILIYLINIYRERNSLEMAFQCISEAEKTVTMKNKPYLFESIAQLYESAGNYKRALNFKDSVIIYNDSLTTTHNRQLAENSRIKMEVMKLTAEMDKQLTKMRQRHYVTLLLLCILALLVTIAIIIIRNQRIKNHNERKVMRLEIEKKQHEKQLAEEQAKAIEMEAHYRQEIMKRSLEQKQTELSVTTMFISSRNKLIEDLLKYLSDIKETQGIPALNNLVQHLKQLLKTSNERDNFLINFESANSDFIKTLKNQHPNLSSSDIRFLAYIRMNLSMKDIASLTNTNPESCKRRKIRISKKLGIESSADLYDYILKM